MHSQGVYAYVFQENIVLPDSNLTNVDLTNDLTNHFKIGRSYDVSTRISNELKQTLSVASSLQDDNVFVFRTDESVKVESLMKKIIKEIALEDNVESLSITNDPRKELYRMNNDQIKRFLSKFRYQVIENGFNVTEVTDFKASQINITKSGKILPLLIENFDKLKNFSLQRGSNIHKAQKENIGYRINKIINIPIENIIYIQNKKIKFNDIKKENNQNYNISDFKWDLNHTFLSSELINLDTQIKIDLLTDSIDSIDNKLNRDIDLESLIDSESQDSEFFPSDSELDSDLDYESDSENSLNTYQKENIENIIHTEIKNKIELTEKLSKLGLKEFEIHGDGNCQFRSIAHQLFNDQNRHSEIRKRACKQLLEKADRYKEFCCTKNYFDWIQYMSKDFSWGDNITLQAISDSYNINIRIITLYQNKSILFINPISQINRNQPKQITILYKPEIHYSSVEPINSEFELANILTNLKNNLT